MRLESYLKLPDDPDDAVVEVGELLAVIHHTTLHLESKHKTWDSDAKSAQVLALEAKVETRRQERDP